MLRVNTTDGRTLTYDLVDPEQLSAWQSALRHDEFQTSISALSIVVREDDRDLVVVAFPAPKFKILSWDAVVVFDDGKLAREVVTCYADAYAASLTVYANRRPVRSRVDFFRPGRRVLRPRYSGP